LPSYVLVVDDDAAIRGLVAQALEFEGFQIETAGTTDEALATVKERAPQLIVLDMKMPDDGPRFEAELKKRSLHAPIVATSASLEGPQWAASIGAHAFLAKPFDIADLRTAVRSAWQVNRGRRPV
jgi:DNA-binding NtrC family response regulator